MYPFTHINRFAKKIETSSNGEIKNHSASFLSLNYGCNNQKFDLKKLYVIVETLTLDVMTRVVVRKTEKEHNVDFFTRVHESSKAMIVDSYPEIYELSGNGFRLLEKYSQMYNWEFILAFYASTEKM